MSKTIKTAPAKPASTKDTGRVHVGGGMMRFAASAAPAKTSRRWQGSRGRRNDALLSHCFGLFDPGTRFLCIARIATATAVVNPGNGHRHSRIDGHGRREHDHTNRDGG